MEKHSLAMRTIQCLLVWNKNLHTEHLVLSCFYLDVWSKWTRTIITVDFPFRGGGSEWTCWIAQITFPSNVVTGSSEKLHTSLHNPISACHVCAHSSAVCANSSTDGAPLISLHVIWQQTHGRAGPTRKHMLQLTYVSKIITAWASMLRTGCPR